MAGPHWTLTLGWLERRQSFGVHTSLGASRKRGALPCGVKTSSVLLHPNGPGVAEHGRWSKKAAERRSRWLVWFPRQSPPGPWPLPVAGAPRCFLSCG